MAERWTLGPKRESSGDAGEPWKLLGDKEAVSEFVKRRKETAKKMGAATLGTPLGAGLGGGVKAVETLGWGVKHLLRMDFTSSGIQPDKTAEDAFGKGFKWARGDSKS
ncbi:MAG: hypothetical protein A3J58_03615 [Candidatus Sungbacteria bacterium RIFCSPHIGHO2_02_FULL_52_23]|uniref:Uncharacterized protein n=1 Tax=Candidatus Sungbacteria bacterium RIFCSPHIGHO2_02_FULL_52_23 TaxID=1802274 RepID=A0A1G2KVK7_9BACT|nr:MAG: hypothetical protein A3J58_03615 [Candidatus Sungbacteria bacterium RIFCSPHIGHO2_02_FULL_52_23]